MNIDLSRRDLLAATGAAFAAGVSGSVGLLSSVGTIVVAAEPERSAAEPFGYCFNTSTIRGQGLDLASEVDLVARAGYQGIEPWVREIEQYEKKGGSLKDLAQRIRDHGLVVASAIGFSGWLDNDDEKRKQGLEQAKRDMDLVRQIGGTRIAAPPVGATNDPHLDLFRAAERYRALLDLGDSLGVVPQLEVWGFSKALSRLSETAFVAMESRHPKACLLPDTYHLYKGGSDFAGLRMLSGDAMHCFHVNDYPASPARDKITDAARVYPGDGVAPLGALFKTLRDAGYRGMLSLELFNQDYWKQDPATVVQTGLEKTRAAVRHALG